MIYIIFFLVTIKSYDVGWAVWMMKKYQALIYVQRLNDRVSNERAKRVQCNCLALV